MIALSIAFFTLITVVSIGFGASSAIFRNNAQNCIFNSAGIGISYLAISSWAIYSFGGKLDLTACLLTIFPMIGLSIVIATLRKHKQKLFLIRIFSRGYIFLLIWLITTTISLIPLLIRPDLSIITLGNNDVAHHTAISRYLSEQGINDSKGFVEIYPYAFEWFVQNTYFSYYSLVAQIASLTNLLPHQVVSGVLGCLSGLIGTATFLIIQIIFNRDKFISVVWSILVSANAINIYLLYNGFGGQLFGQYFSLLLFYHLAFSNSSSSQFPPNIAKSSLIILSMAGLFLSYQHMLPFTIGLSVGWIFISNTRQNLLSRTAKGIISTAIGLLGCCVLFPNRIWGFFIWMGEAASSQSGWPVNLLYPEYLLGFLGSKFDQQHLASLESVPLPQRLIIWTLLIFVIFSALLLKHKLRDRDICIKFGIISILLYLGGVILCLMEPDNSWTSYRSFKFLTFFGSFFIIFVGSCWYLLWRTNIYARVSANLISFIYFCFWLQGIISVCTGDGKGNSLSHTFDEYSDAKFDASNRSYNIVLGHDYWMSMWFTYFYMNNEVYNAYPSYYPETSLNGNTTILARSTKFAEIHSNQQFPASEDYSIVRDSKDIFVSLGRGWHGAEEDLVWMGTNGATAELEIVCTGVTSEITVSIQLIPLLQNNQYSVYWNDSVVVPFTPDNILSFNLKNVKNGRNILMINSQLEPEQPSTNDIRLIAFGLKKIELTAN